MTRALLAGRLALGALLAFPLLGAGGASAPAAASAAPWPHDPEAVVQRVLAQPAYRTAPVTTDRKPKPDLWDQIWSWIESGWTWIKAQLKNLFGPIGRAVGASSGAGAVAGLVLTVAAVLGLAFAIVRLALAFVAPEARTPGVFRGRALAERRSAAELRAVASAYAARDEYARAIAALFGAALAALDERALVPFDPSRTPGEYRRLVRRAREPAAPPFDDLASGFVRAAYSGEAAGREDFMRAERALAAFEPLVASP